MNPVTIIIVLGLGVLFFGKNLPDVARQVGLAFMEFRKGMSEFGSVLDLKDLGTSSKSVRRSSSTSKLPEDISEERQEVLGEKFEPPAG